MPERGPSTLEVGIVLCDKHQIGSQRSPEASISRPATGACSQGHGEPFAAMRVKPEANSPLETVIAPVAQLTDNGGGFFEDAPHEEGVVIAGFRRWLRTGVFGDHAGGGLGRGLRKLVALIGASAVVLAACSSGTNTSTPSPTPDPFNLVPVNASNIPWLADAAFIPLQTQLIPLFRSERVHNAIYFPLSGSCDITKVWLPQA
jgi:hypothetical protein